MNKQDCILFSGGAKGSEAAFGAIAEEHGIEEVNFSFEGHSIERQRGLRVLNHEELLRGDVSLEYVSRLMNRRYTETPTLRKLLQSIWYQVNSGQEIYVIGEIVVYIVLGSLALKRGRTVSIRRGCFVAAIAVFLFVYVIARTHDPLGPLRLLLP